MTTLSLLLKLIHILTAFWFVCGLVGRQVCLTLAARATTIPNVQALLQAAGVFERRMVIPGWTAVVVAGLVAAWAEGWPILGFLQGGASNWVLVSLLLFLSSIPLIIWVFLPRGRVFEKAMEDAVAQGQVTPELTAAFHNRAVALGHAYELAVVAVVVTLMVTKPF